MWDRIKRTDKPVVLYGTGNAAERILNELDVRGIRASGIFASDRPNRKVFLFIPGRS